MKVEIRQAVDSDRDIFIEYAVKLSNFNRKNHNSECTYDNYEDVMHSIKRNALETFNNRNEDTLILIAELEGTPVGYALGRIFEENEAADNGTGRMGLFDELFLDDAARGHGLGQRLLDETVNWMKERGINRIKLHAYSWNDHAKKLYARNGFKEYAVSYETFIKSI
ncbi:GNAT family N-acetyltransferase [Bacillus sp. JJ1609]|uniref:GNAT family N-acetyltransferase n=1 Tax=Bacillus sp. JJ1609 TaxID=3122977 RepID=UPI002FFEAE33